MFDNEKDDPNAMRDDQQRKQAVRVDPEGDEAPTADGDDLEMPPGEVKERRPFFQRALEKAIQHATVDSIECTESKYRDQFAVVAMGSIVSCDMQRAKGFEPVNIAQRAYDVAEAMLTERAVRESFGHRRSAEVVAAITEGRAAMKSQLNEAEKVCGLADNMNRRAASAKEHAEKIDLVREKRLQRVRELVEAETSPGLSAMLIAAELGIIDLEAQALLDEVRAERQG